MPRLDLPLGPLPPPPQPSDQITKKDIVRIGTTVLGLPLYQFSYIDKEGVYEGVMAQDVLMIRPDAVSLGDNDCLCVDYAALGIALKKL